MHEYSETTKTHYESFDKLLEEESNGWVVVCILKHNNKVFARVVGPFPEKRLALNKSNVLRRRFKKEAPEHPNTELLTVSLEPAWKDL
jgi:hypothetical protein